MRDIAVARLAEDPVCHGMADEAADVDLVHTDCFSELCVRSIAVKRHSFGDIVVVECLEGEVVVVLPGAKQGYE